MVNVINIKLGGDQALVFFDMTADIVEGNRKIDKLEISEEMILSDIVAQLERSIVEVFDEKYDIIVSNAKNRIENSRNNF